MRGDGCGVWRNKKKVVGSGVVRAVLCERAKTATIRRIVDKLIVVFWLHQEYTHLQMSYMASRLGLGASGSPEVVFRGLEQP